MLQTKSIYRSGICENLAMYVRYLVKVNFKVLVDRKRMYLIIRDFSTLARTGLCLFLRYIVNKTIS